MGWYLNIDYHETNSKHRSKILIDTIKELDTKIRNSEKLTAEQKEVFIPEENSYDDALTDYRITQKGIALLSDALRDLSFDTERLRQRAMKEYEYAIKHNYKEGSDELEAAIDQWTEEERKTVEYLVGFVAIALVDMVLYNKETIYAHWV